ncbi:hypothetical protein LTS15_009476 [Exophiala xenobiotica]|nr:hypothetical protein LTS15_009476 [Exophiala xenobiotica]
MRIYCHPKLRDHENIAKLLYFGWEYGSLVPILSLEFAAYGSLKHILHERQDLSENQKCNISLDIVSGLYALHCNDFAHGDLKPGNVIIQHHPHRQLVAKLIDFCGIIELRNLKSSLLPPFVTPIWLAPEVLTLVDEVDWQKSDMYSFGPVFSQLWSREDEKGHECFLVKRAHTDNPEGLNKPLRRYTGVAEGLDDVLLVFIPLYPFTNVATAYASKIYQSFNSPYI